MPHSASCRRGFTLVEAAIVLVVIAALLAGLLPVLREREEQRLRALAEAEPWEVFEFHAAPAKNSFPEDEDVAIRCEIVNPTNYPLALPERLREFLLTFEDTDYVIGKKVGPTPPIPDAPIAPGGSVSFDLKFRVDGVGAAEVRVAYWSGASPFTTIGVFTIERQSPALGKLSGQGKRFQTNAVSLLVDAKDGSESLTFREIIAGSSWLE